MHSSHYPLTWWSSPFHLCLPSSPIHKVSPGSSSRSLTDEASLKTCSCGCNWREERKERVTCLLYLFFASIYFTSFNQHLNTFKVVKNTVRIQTNKNRPAGLLIFVTFSEEAERRPPFPMAFEPKYLAGESCYTSSVSQTQYSFVIDSSTGKEEHFHSLPSPVQMPRDWYRHPFSLLALLLHVTEWKTATLLFVYGYQTDSTCKCCCTWSVSINPFLRMTSERLQYLWAHSHVSLLKHSPLISHYQACSKSDHLK